MVLACRFWFGMSKKDCPPSPCNSTFAPMVPLPLVAAAPGTPDAGRNWSAGAAILKRIGKPLVHVSYNPRHSGDRRCVLDHHHVVQYHAAVLRLRYPHGDLHRLLESSLFLLTSPVALGRWSRDGQTQQRKVYKFIHIFSIFFYKMQKQ